LFRSRLPALHFRRRRVARRPAALAALLLILAGSMAGCRLERPRVVRELRGTIYIAVGVSDDALDAELQSELRQRMARLQTMFRALHPDVRLQVQVYPEDSLSNELRIRNRTGLAPDLLVVNQSTARELSLQGLIRPVRFAPTVTDQLDPGSIARAQRSNGSLVGLPLDLQPQLACFDKRRVKQSPATLKELQASSAKGLEVGFAIDAANLAWTLGPLGAIESVSSLMANGTVTPLARERIGGWLQWLHAADQQRHITVFPSQTQLVDQLMIGGLDWISCRSINFTRLKTKLGKYLGVAPLPAGPYGPASPITEERVLAFGVNSSQGQRQLAEALAGFAISPLNQRDLIVHGENVLPVNLQVTPPVQSSGLLAAMVMAHQQSLRSGTFRLVEKANPTMVEEWATILNRFLFDDLNQQQTLDGLIEILRPASRP
jgi:arabinogalactan oligomer/maltooligosaccharide transport system substrate-binding protein